MGSPDHTAALEDFICNVPLFHGLNRGEIATMASHMERLHLESGETLFNQWDRADCVYFVEEGALDVLTKSGPETYTSIATLHRGRSIGEMSLIDNFPRSATVKAKSDAEVVRLSRKKFDQLMKRHADIGINILKGLARLMAQNLKKTSSRLADNMLPLG